MRDIARPQLTASVRNQRSAFVPAGIPSSPLPAPPRACARSSSRDVLAVTVIDRSPSFLYPSSPTAAGDNDHASTPASTPPPRPPPPYIAEAEPLLCTHWGAGGRPTRLTCRVAPPPPEEERVPGEAPWGARAGLAAAATAEVEAVSSVQLAICWSPAIRLRWPLSLVARAGRLTGRVISSKVGRHPRTPWRGWEGPPDLRYLLR